MSAPSLGRIERRDAPRVKRAQPPPRAPRARRVVAAFAASLVAACGAVTSVDPPTDPISPLGALAHARDYVEWAVNASERAAEITDEELRTRLALAEALVAESEYDTARRHLELLVRVRPLWWSNHLAYARALYFGAADAGGAQRHIDACLELDPTIAGCHELQGMLLVDAGAHERALASYVTAAELTGGDPQTFERIARVLLRLERYDDARAWTDRALELSPRSVSVRLLRATIEERSGEVAAAEAQFRWIATFHRDERLGATYLIRFLQRQGRDAEAAELEQDIGVASPR